MPNYLGDKLAKLPRTQTSWSPVKFGEKVLGLDFYDWQAEALLHIWQSVPTSLLAANESGKTTYVIAPLVLWFLARYCQRKPYGRIVLTSGSWTQVRTQLVPAITDHAHLFPELKFLENGIKHKSLTYDDHKNYLATFISTDQEGRAEGAHSRDWHEGPLLVIIDEAKSIEPKIFGAFNRCSPAMQLWTSSAGLASGPFFQSHTDNKHLFHTIKVTSDMCPHIPKSTIERDRKEFGEADPLFRSKHFSEFIGGIGDVIIPREDVEACMADPPLHLINPRVAFCDFAAGGDENVLALRDGNRVEIVDAWRQGDTMAAVGKFIRHFETNNLSPGQIWGDADGLGAVMLDALEDQGWRCNRYHANSAPKDKDAYRNASAECWNEGGRKIRNRKVILPNDATLIKQLTTRRSIEAPNGTLAVEKKADMLEQRGLSSPDRADAVLGAMYCGGWMSGAIDEVTLGGIKLHDRGIGSRLTI